MGWIRFSRGHRLEPTGGEPAETIVALLHDLGQPTEVVLSVAARWAAAVPTTAFVAFDGIEQLDPPPCGGQWRTMLDLEAGAEPLVLDRVVRHLEPLLAPLDASRLVLVGFHHGGTVALHLVLRHGWSCAGVLAFSPKLTQPLPRTIRIDAKIRLIESVESGHVGDAGLRDAVASLAARGVDARGVRLAGSTLSDEAIRHGGAYLGELIATAQRGYRFHVLDRETRHAS
jgi:predicted esterase